MIFQTPSKIKTLLAFELPDVDGFVFAAAGEETTVGAKADRQDGELMSGEGAHQTSGFDFPFFDGAVHAAGVEGVVVGGKGDRNRLPRR